MSTQIDLGPVLSIPKGDWDASTTYERLNLVRHNSAAWICNVDTSIGVEPSEDSEDWFLQVKDTSSVSSVNGMRGDVEITTIQTPSDDSDDISITNTEWVRDRIDETINSTQSYTDNAISAATTSILNTAAQDASNKATVAVNQALTASEAKFAAKETVNNLVDNVSTLTENDTVQNKAIANKLDKSGGTMTGPVILPSRGSVTGAGDGSTVLFSQHGDYSQSCIIAYNNTSANAGSILLRAQKTGANADMWLNSDGSATINSNTVLTSAGGTLMEPLSGNGVIVRGNNAAGYVSFEANYGGAELLLYGGSRTDAYAGRVELKAKSENENSVLAFLPSGKLWVGAQRVLTTAGDTLTGPLILPSGGSLTGAAGDLSTVIFSRHGDYAKPCVILWGGDGAEKVLIRAQNENAMNNFWLYPDGTATLGGHSVLTTANSATIAGYALPSSRFIELTLGASGTIYTAPANGWLYLQGESSATNGYVTLSGSGISPIASANANGYLSCFRPVRKGEVIEVLYAALTGVTFRFYYAEGVN